MFVNNFNWVNASYSGSLLDIVKLRTSFLKIHKKVQMDMVVTF
jgi:hypothetical protein